MTQPRRFHDFDQLCEELEAWDLELRPLDRGVFDGEFLQATGQETLLSHARFERLIEQHGSPPPGV